MAFVLAKARQRHSLPNSGRCFEERKPTTRASQTTHLGMSGSRRPFHAACSSSLSQHLPPQGGRRIPRRGLVQRRMNREADVVVQARNGHAPSTAGSCSPPT